MRKSDYLAGVFDETHIWDATTLAQIRRLLSMRGGIHPTAVVGGPPEQRGYIGDGIAPEIHSTARIGALATVDAGAIRPTRIGAFSWVFAHAHIGHDVQIGEEVEVCSGAIIGGGVVLEDEVKIGIGAVILPRQVVGRGAQVGAGAVVTRDVAPEAVVVGNPARRIR